MPFVKLVITDYHSTDDYYGSDITRVVQDLTDWEEISHEDLVFINKYKYQLWAEVQKQYVQLDGHYNFRMNICVLDDMPLKERLTVLKEKLADQVAKEKEAAEKRAEAAKNRRAQKALQKAAQEKKTYEALKAKFGDGNAVPSSSGS